MDWIVERGNLGWGPREGIVGVGEVKAPAVGVNQSMGRHCS